MAEGGKNEHGLPEWGRTPSVAAFVGRFGRRKLDGWSGSADGAENPGPHDAAALAEAVARAEQRELPALLERWIYRALTSDDLQDDELERLAAVVQDRVEPGCRPVQATAYLDLVVAEAFLFAGRRGESAGSAGADRSAVAR